MARSFALATNNPNSPLGTSATSGHLAANVGFASQSVIAECRLPNAKYQIQESPNSPMSRVE
jgi:hypothetical protein